MDKKKYHDQLEIVQLVKYKSATKEKKNWTILERIGEGASAVCYKAVSDGVIGHLKCISFSDTFIYAYNELMRVKSASSDNEILYNFVPYMELFENDVNDGNEVLYTWAPEDAVGETLSAFFGEIRNDNGNRENNLYKVIGLIISIVQGISVLHRAGLLHLDIKPSNFLVPYAALNEINEHIISMYDIDSFKTMLDVHTGKISKTKGFAAPEVETNADIRSDIYSIGATLYNAFIEDGDDNLYSKDKFFYLDEYVKDSPFIKGTEYEQNDYLVYYLTKILRKCLIYGNNLRYSCCEELLEDLYKVRTEMIPIVKRTYVNVSRKIKIEDADKNINPTAILQTVLYKDPLYLYADENKNIEVLVIGDGAYARRFTDLCLQSAQMSGYTIRIVNLANEDPEFACKVYKELRVGMTEFVRVNGEFKRTDQKPYGEIVFDKLPLDFSSYKFNRGDDIVPVVNQIKNLLGDKKLSYVFVSVGEDNFNRNIANRIAEILIDESISVKGAPVYYSIQDEEPDVMKERELFFKAKALYLNVDYDENADEELERWAFNTHLTWMTDKNPDYYEAKDLYDQRYNHDASVAFALSIKYILFSMGIEIDKLKDSKQIEEILSNNLDYVHAAHRRWVVQKLCDGWKGFYSREGKTDYSICIAKGSVKIEEDRMHPCLVYDSPTEYLQNYTDEMWDNPGEHDNKLDELDMMSVNVYRQFREYAFSVNECFKQGNYKHVDFIRSMLKEHIYSADDFNMITKFCDCAEEILAGFEDKEKQRSLCAKFDSLYGYLAKVVDKEYGNLLEELRKDVFAIEQYIYRIDYKLHDKRLIKKIPFIIGNMPKPYEPRPIDVEGVELTEELELLIEKLASNDHDVWVKKRMEEGWVYGSVRDEMRKTNPCIMPFDRLPEKEKEYTRAMARQYIRVLKKWGYL